MNDIDNGGPAFPAVGNTIINQPFAQGMSLRDWFAGQALAGLASQAWATTESHKIPRPKRLRCIAIESYAFADAMLSARKETAK